MEMRISKTMFKEYTRCPRVCALDDIYMKKLNTHVSPFANDEYFDILETLHLMFDEETGEDLIDITDPQHEALLPYYQQLEDYAMEVAKRKFGNNIIHNIDVKKQKSFNFFDNYNHEYYCYLDGFQETDDEVRVFEVKATTSKKFQTLGPVIKNRQYSIFECKDNIMKISNEVEMSDEKFISNYQKLFDRYSDCGKYVYDLAIERYFIEKSCEQFHIYQNKKFTYYLVVLNSDYTFDGKYVDGKMAYKPDQNGQEIVTFINLTDVTSQCLIDIKFNHRRLQKYLEDLKVNDYQLGEFCRRKKKDQCLFYKICWEKVLNEGSILEYLGLHHGFRDELNNRIEPLDLINKGYYTIDSIPRKWLNRKNNVIQRDCYDNNVEFIHFAKILRGIDTLKYPLYYLDFESFNSPLPRFKGEHPYQQSLFQYSLHIEKSPGQCDFDKDHQDFLASDFDDHRIELVSKLINDIDLKNGGTVIVYNKNFEYERIKELMKLFPQYKDQLENINKHMFDLLYLIMNNKEFYLDLGFPIEDAAIINYYNNKLHGSYSIKKVLPLFSDLTYQGMEIANGTEAITAYASFKNLLPVELEKVKENLRKYCKQDTWAMYVVLMGLKKKVGLI